MKKKVIILGATGCIGQHTVELILANEEKFNVVGLSAYKNASTLQRQAAQLKPKKVYLEKGTRIDLPAGTTYVDDINDLFDEDYDIVVCAISGIAALKPTLKALQKKIVLAIANKESLVVGGHLIKEAARKNGSTLVPVDSEHSAIFQARDQKNPFSLLTLTASGGPFWGKEQSKNISVAQALAHPNWVMGPKNSIDSATIMNKGLELIEACVLFDTPPEKIDVVVHRESIIHGLVHYEDGSVLAQMGMPDMKTPIAYALAYPQRIKTPVAPLSLSRLGSMTFFDLDIPGARAIALARYAAKNNKTHAFNTLNEIAVEAFLEERLAFTEIVPFTEKYIDCEKNALTLEEILQVEKNIRERFKKKTHQ